MEEDYGFIHYIKVDDNGNITDGWSSGPNYNKDTTDAIVINEKGDYQFRLVFPDGTQSEENPSLWDWNGINLYKYIDRDIIHKTDEEIQAEIDLIPPPPPSAQDQMRADIDFISAMTGIEL